MLYVKIGISKYSSHLFVYFVSFTVIFHVKYIYRGIHLVEKLRIDAAPVSVPLNIGTEIKYVASSRADFIFNCNFKSHNSYFRNPTGRLLLAADAGSV